MERRVRQILFPTDYSGVSGTAGRTAARLARHFNARLHVVHVVPPLTDPGPPAALSTAVADLGPGLELITAIVMGRPAREIIAYTQRRRIDLIVMGTHGRTGVSRALLGSVAEAVVRRAPVWIGRAMRRMPLKSLASCAASPQRIWSAKAVAP